MLSLNPALNNLESAQLIRALTETERAYFFRHILVQQSAYDTLLKHERRDLHRAIADALREHAQVPDEELARHYAAAELHAQSAHYFTLAAQHARTRFANAEAQTFFHAALAAWRNVPDAPTAPQLELYEGLGELLTLQGHHTDALDAYDGALNFAQDPLARARLLRKKGDVYQVLLQFEKTTAEYAAAETALGVLDATQPRARWEEWIWIQLGMMNNNYWHGHWQQVRALTDRARPFVDQYGTPGIRATFLDRVEMMYARRNRYVMDDETRELVVAMRAAAEESGDPHHILNARFSMAFVDLRRRALDLSESEFLWSIERARALGDALYELWALTYLAVLYRYRGDLERVRVTVRASFLVEGAVGTPWYGAGMANLAWVALQENNEAEARRLAEDALKIWEPFGELYPFKTLALFPLLELARRENAPNRAQAHIREILNPTQESLDDVLVDALEHAQDRIESGALENALALACTLGFI